MGFFKKKRRPTPPDPYKVAEAQTGQSIITAQINRALQNIGQVTPFGTLRYRQTGTQTFTDPNTGKTYEIPTTEAVTELTPEQQRIFSNLQSAATRVSGRLGQPLQLGGGRTEGRLFELGRQRLDPLFEQRRAGLEQRLANQGITPGSEAYNRAITQFQQGQSDAYNQLLLSGRQQAVQEQIAERTLPLNELSALLSGQQTTAPQFTPARQPTIPTTDLARLIGQDYQQRAARIDAINRGKSNILGGLFSLGGNLLGAAGKAGGFGALFSDKRLKRNIERVGKLANGLSVYVFNYITGGPKQIGLIAQEVLKVKPEAIGTRNGFLTVNYSMAVK